MDVLVRFRSLFAYDAWATRETLATLGTMAPPPPQGVRLMGHLIGAKALWLARLRQTPAVLPVWPTLPLDAAAPHLDALDRDWEIFLDTLTEKSSMQYISYINSKGEPWGNTVADVLDHVVLHGAYHRGQIALIIRAEGHAPPAIDFIHAKRRHLIP